MKFYPYLALIIRICIRNCISNNGGSIEFNSFGKPEKIIFCNRIIEKNVVYLFPFIFWMSQFSCQIAVVGKQKYSCCCLIKTSYRVNSFCAFVTYKIENGVFSMRILNRCYIVFRLIHKDIYLFLGRKFLVFIYNFIIITDLCSHISYYFPVHRYQSVFYMLVGIPSRTNTAICNKPVESYL